MSATVQRIEANGVAVAYRRSGAGRPLLLIHGAEGDHSIYHRLQDLSAARFDVIAYDQRDCGGSKLLRASPYTPTDLADDAAALIEALGFERVHVLGSSAGGVLAQLLALRHPQRIDRLILSVTFPINLPLTQINPAGLQRRAELIMQGEAGDAGLAELFTTPEYVARNPDVIERIRTLRSAVPSELQARRMAALTTPVVADPAQIRCPTLVVAAEQDQIVPLAAGRRLAAAIPGAKFVSLPSVGHIAALQAPDQLAVLAQEFLDGE